MEEDDLKNTTLLIPTFISAIQTHLQEKKGNHGQQSAQNIDFTLIASSSFQDITIVPSPPLNYPPERLDPISPETKSPPTKREDWKNNNNTARNLKLEEEKKQNEGERLVLQETCELLDLISHVLTHDLKSHLHSTQKNAVADAPPSYLSSASIHNIKNEVIVKFEKDELVNKLLELIILQLVTSSTEFVHQFLQFENSQQQKQKELSTESSLYGLIYWLNIHKSSFSDSVSKTLITSSIFKDKTHLNRICNTIDNLLDIIAQDHYGACFLSRICINLLKERTTFEEPSQWGVVTLMKKLIRNEELAYHFCIKLEGALFLLEELNSSISSSNFDSSEISKCSVSQAILSDIATKGYPNPETNFQPASSHSNSLQTLNHLCSVLTKDAVLNRLLKDSGPSSPCIWIHNFKKGEDLEKEYNVELSLPRDVVLREINIQAMQHYLISSGTSLFPPIVVIETGSSLERMLPSGRLLCEADPNMSSSRCYTSSFKFILPSLEVSRFLRMKFYCPVQSSWIAISRIQLKGYSLDSPFSIENTKQQKSSSPLKDLLKLPLPIGIDLFAHCLKFKRVVEGTLKLDMIETKVEALLEKVEKDTCIFIEEIFWSLSQTPSLCTRFLDKTLEIAKNTHYACIVSKLSSIQDSETHIRLQKLSDFILKNLTTDRLFLKPFLLAFCKALYTTRNITQKLNISPEFSTQLFFKTLQLSVGSPFYDACISLLATILRYFPNHFDILLQRVIPSNLDQLVKLLEDEQATFRIIGILIGCSEHTCQVFLNSNLADSIVKLILKMEPNHLSLSEIDILERLIPFLEIISVFPPIKVWIGKYLLSFLFHVCIISTTLFYGILNILKSSISLQPENQIYLSSLVIEHISTSPLSPLGLQLFNELFEFQDQIYLCFGTDIHSNSKQNKINFDPHLSDPTIQFDINFTTALCNTTAKWSTALTSHSITSGVHKWEVFIEKCTSTCNIMIGVSEKSHPVGNFVGMDPNSWSFYGCNGYTYHAGASKSYGTRLRQGDSLIVELDMNTGSISFSKAGYSFGLAYSGLEGKQLYPSVSLYDLGDAVSIFSSNPKNEQQNPLSHYEIGVDSHLKYYRIHPIFRFPSYMTLSELISEFRDHSSFNSDLKDKTYDQPILLQKIFQNLSKNIKNQSLLDFDQLVSQISQQTIQKKKQPAPPFISKFIKKGGLEKIIPKMSSYFNHHQYSPVWGNFSKEWPKFLDQLSLFLQIDGYSSVFARSPESLSLLISLMKLIRVHELNLCSSYVLKSQPILNCDPLYDSFFTLLKQSQNYEKNQNNKEKENNNNQNNHEKKTESFEKKIKNQAFDIGVLKIILKRLSTLSAIEPLNPPIFQDPKDQKESKNKKRDERSFWAKGTGFGTGSDENQSNWSQNEYSKQQDLKAHRICSVIRGLSLYLSFPISEPIPEGIYQLILDSCLLPFLESYLRNDSLLDIIKFFDLYFGMFELIRTLATHSGLVTLLSKRNIPELIEKLEIMSTIISKTLEKSKTLLSNNNNNQNNNNKNRDSCSIPTPSPSTSTQKSSQNISSEQEERLVSEIKKTATIALFHLKIQKEKEMISKLTLGEQISQNNNISIENTSFQKEYLTVLKKLQFRELSLKNQNNIYIHHYKSSLDQTAPPQKLRRLIQEIGSMNTGLPLFWDSSIFVVIDSDRIDVLKSIITGPPGTPYSNGIFEFDIYCPKDYPNVPPLVNLQTNGGGSVRFNPNLYNCGKVCLSLLGTWRGSETEKWNEKTSTLLQVLVSIQSLILVSEPYFNEPGYETEMGTPSGIQNSTEYSEVIQIATMRWAITEQLKNSSFVFKEIIKEHFKLKRNEIVKTCQQWISHAASRASSNTQNLQKNFKDMIKELEKLGPLDEISQEETKKLTYQNEQHFKKLFEMFPNLSHTLITEALKNSKDPESAISTLLEKSNVK